MPSPAPKPGMILVRSAVSLLSSGTERSLVRLASASLASKAKQRPDQVRRVVEKARTDGPIEAYQQASTRLDTDVALGYSSAGYVLDPGTATDLQVGQRVACAGRDFASHAEIVRIPELLCIPIPDDIDLDSAAFVMVGAIALHSVRCAEPTLGETVAVVGLGLLGQLSVQILKAAGCKVIAIDPVAKKRDLAMHLGANVALGPDEVSPGKSHAADHVILTAASDSAPLELAAQLARGKGRIVAVGGTKLEVPRQEFFEKELTLVVPRASGPGSLERDYELKNADYPVKLVRWTQRRNMEEFLDLIAQGKVQVHPLVSRRVPIEEAKDAYASLADDPHTIGILLTYQDVVEPTPRIEIAPAQQRTARMSRDSVNIAVIGAGLFARTTLLPALRKVEGVHLHTISASTGHSTADLGRKFGFKAAATDTDSVLGDEEIDAVIIATRHDSHAELAASALRRGKHVFVEKPMALTVDSVDHLKSAVAEAPSNVVFAVGFNRRFAPHTQAAREWFADITPTVITMRINAGHVSADSWVQDTEEGGGRILGEVCHFVDLAQALAGSLTESVFAQSLPTAGGSHSDDLVVSLQLADGSIASITYTASGSRAIARELIEVHGGDRSAVIENFRKVTLAGGRRTKRSVKRLRMDRGYIPELQAFIDAIRTGSPSPVAFGDHVRTTLATIGIEESLRQGTPIEVSTLMSRGR